MDVKEGEGGFVIVCGLYKSWFLVLVVVKWYEDGSEYGYASAFNAGDAVLFSEVIMYGMLVWKGKF